MATPTLYEQGTIRSEPMTVQGRAAMYVNPNRWTTTAGDVLGPFKIFSYNHGGRGPQLYIYLRVNDTWYFFSTKTGSAYMREFVRRVGWAHGITDQAAMTSMGEDLRTRVGQAVAGAMQQSARVAEVARQEQEATRSAPPSTVPKSEDAPLLSAANLEQYAPAALGVAALAGGVWYWNKRKKGRK